jgi:hypothetical protein
MRRHGQPSEAIRDFGCRNFLIYGLDPLSILGIFKGPTGRVLKKKIMINHKKSILAAGVALVAAASTNAATISYTLFDTVSPQPLDWSQLTIAVQQWNPALFPGATLNSAYYTLDGSIIGDARGENSAGSPATITLTLGASLTAILPGVVGLYQTLPTATQSFGATAFDGLNDFDGTSGQTFLGLSGLDSDIGTITGSLVGFIGAGNVITPGILLAQGSSTGTGSGNVTTQFSSAAGAKLTITYDYTPAEVPEASTYAAAFGLVGLVGFRWFRSRR